MRFIGICRDEPKSFGFSNPLYLLAENISAPLTHRPDQ
jgi:hypothetical protein